MKTIRYFETLLLALLTAGCTSQKILPTQSIAELDTRIETIFKASSLPGFSIIVVDNSGVLYQKSMGFADITSQKEYTDRTIQNIASVSKTFIGVAIMKAVDQGKLKLDDPINQYLPFKVVHPKFPDTPITIRHLATHTSGIRDGDVYQKSYVLENPQADYSYLPAEILEHINPLKENKSMDDSEYLRRIFSENGIWNSKENFTKKAPGVRYEYSNIGASLAAYVLENAVAIPYETYTKQFIFDPLKMKQTCWEENEGIDANRATLYFSKDLVVPDYHLNTYQDGGLLTNPSDFGKYLSEMIRGYQGNGTILSQQAYKQLFTKQEVKGGSSGIFWGISDKGNPNHSGSDPGTLTITAISVAKEKAIYLVSNADMDTNPELMSSLRAIWKSVANHNWQSNTPF